MGYQKIGDYLFAKIIKKFNLNDEKIINMYEYIKRNEQLQRDISSFLLEDIETLPKYNKEQVLDYLFELYVDKKEGPVAEYIIATPQKDLYTFYDENDYFRKDIIDNFINALTTNSFRLQEPQKEEIKKENIVSITSLPDLVRNSYMYMYKVLTANGMNKELFNQMMVDLISTGGIIKTDDRKLELAIRCLLEYKELFIRLMYADLYIIITMMQNHSNKYDAIISFIIEHYNNNNYELPEDRTLAAEFFGFMASINDDMEIKAEILKNSSEEDKEIYRKINPLSIIEGINYKRG